MTGAIYLSIFKDVTVSIAKSYGFIKIFAVPV